jgi:NADP-dependent 3-hydroxy acid dehydrogenase YdfG
VGGNALAVATDVTDCDQVKQLVDRAVERFGRVEVMLNNAGLPDTVADPAVANRIQKLYKEMAIPADSFARAVAYAMSQPDDVDVNEILFRPTRQEY